MLLDAFRVFTERVRARLELEPDVVGLVALGSTADLGRAPDDQSDHDLWIVTRPGRQEGWRRRQDWLPESERIVFVFRETEHGLKVVYDDGHLVEYAVFGRDELGIARANDYRVLLDRDEVEAEVAACAARTEAIPPSDLTWLFGQALTHLLVGVRRFRRGEALSGHRFVRQYAVDRLLALIAQLEPPADPTAIDDLDPYRRFERAHPDRARQLSAALVADVPEAARRLLDLLADLGQHRPELPESAVAAVRGLLETDH